MSNNNGWNNPKRIRIGKNKFQGKNKWYEEQKKTIKNAKKSKSWFFGSIKKIDRPLT